MQIEEAKQLIGTKVQIKSHNILLSMGIVKAMLEFANYEVTISDIVVYSQGEEATVSGFYFVETKYFAWPLKCIIFDKSEIQKVEDLFIDVL